MHARNLALAIFLLGCSEGGGGAPPVEDDDDDSVDARGDTDAAKKDASPAKRDASLDASKPKPPLQRSCMPGFYDGDFNCVISGLLPWFGKLHFKLVSKTMNAGEFAILTVVPGTQISGNDDSLGGMFTATLGGDFDCSTGKFTGQLTDGIYMYGPMPYHMEGPLEGTYRSDGGSGFDGTMGPLTSPDFDLFGPFAPSAMCTWKASYAGEEDSDASAP